MSHRVACRSVFVRAFTKITKSVVPDAGGDLCLLSSIGFHGGRANGCLLCLCHSLERVPSAPTPYIWQQRWRSRGRGAKLKVIKVEGMQERNLRSECFSRPSVPRRTYVVGKSPLSAHCSCATHPHPSGPQQMAAPRTLEFPLILSMK